jgi:Tat protein translocase TatB subunit
MIGSIGFPELIFIFVVALLVFGPKKLPDVAKMLGKTIREFRKTVNDAKATIEEEIEKADISEDLRELDKDIKQMTGADIAQDLKELDKDIKQMTGLEEDEKKENPK